MGFLCLTSNKMADARPKVKKKSSPVKSKQECEKSAKNKQLEAAIRAQVAAEEKAHRIVEKLVLEENVDENYFLEIGNYITPSHYMDITEERALGKVCGYPMCSKPMSKILQQKYKISVQTNRVFDISERKHFCSNQCYKASKYYEAQIPTSPVWSRTKEEMKTFTLLKTLDTSSRSGGGDVMVGSIRQQDYCMVDDTEDNIQLTDEMNHTLIDSTKSQSKNASLPQTANKPKNNITKTSNSCSPNKERSIPDNSEHDEFHHQRILSEKTDSKEDDKNSPQVNLPPCCSQKHIGSSDGVSKKGFQIYNKTKSKDDRVSTKDIFVNCIKETLRDWFSLASYQYLNMDCKGENTTHGGRVEEDSDTLLSFNERALGFLKLDKKTQKNDDDDSDDDDRKKEDAVKTKPQITSENITITEREHPSKEFACIVPPIDSKSQVAIRRQIIQQKMTHLLPEMVESSQINIREMEAHFSKLVKTFRVSSQNVMFKPLEWRGLVASLLYLIHQNLHVDSSTNIKGTMQKTLNNLDLTQQDMDDIISSLSLDRIDETKSCKETQSKTEDGQTESYSHMEDLD